MDGSERDDDVPIAVLEPATERPTRARRLSHLVAIVLLVAIVVVFTLLWLGAQNPQAGVLV